MYCSRHKSIQISFKGGIKQLAPYIVDYKFKVYHDSDAFVAKQGLQNNRSNPNMWIRMFDVLEAHSDPVGPNVDDAADRLKVLSFILKVY